MARNKTQHWVPKSYLDAWIDPATPDGQDGYVHVFDRDGTNHRKRAPKNILAMTDLYTILSDGVRDLRIEDAFSCFEQAFIQTRKKLESDEVLDSDDAGNLYIFVGSMMARPPHRISHFTNQFAAILKKARSIKINHNVAPIRPLTSGRSMTLDEFQEMVDSPMGTWFPDAVAGNVEALCKLFGCDIYVNESEHPFLTNDAPAVTQYPPRNTKYVNMPRGLNFPGCEITFPVSPRYALLFRHKEHGIDKYLRANWETVFEMNFRTITMATQSIISNCDDIYFVKTITDRVAEVDGK